MKWLVDAQLPRRLALLLREFGEDAIHTLELPQGNLTTDDEISRRSIAERRVVVTKDRDFVASFHLRGRPWKLLLIATGNISNDHLDVALRRLLPKLIVSFETASFIEVTRDEVLVHG